MNKSGRWPELLLSWFDQNKRDLPWRENKDPYRIWVSEIMLQQTRVETVKPYFENWLKQFPTLESLAEAPMEEVLKAWQGLGYYSRAKNLQMGVQEVLTQYGGQIPRERKAVEGLRGIGAYTAGAILSIAYNQREHAVDGNVLRVYARLYGIEEDVLTSSAKKKITALVQDTLPVTRPGDFNEALMDFGSAICIPKKPHCGECPLQQHCLAYERGMTEFLPVRVKKVKLRQVYVSVALVEAEGHYLLHRRPDTGLLASLWEFPSCEGDAWDVRQLETKVLPYTGAVELQPLSAEELTHTFSHLRWHMKAFGGKIKKKLPLPEDWRWVRKEDFTSLPWAGPYGKLTTLTM